MELIYNAKAATQVLGCILKNPQLLVDNNYSLSPNDFQDRLHKIVFSATFNLFSSGVAEVSVIAIEDFLVNYVDLYKHYKDQGGTEYILNAVEIAELKNFDFNYEIVKKHSLLRDLAASKDFDISYFYPMGNLVEVVERQAAFERLSKASRQDIVKYYQQSLANVQTLQAVKSATQISDASDGARSLKEQLKAAPEFGYNLENAFFNTICRGARKTKFYIETAASSSGKAIPNNTYIPTPQGMRQVKDIKVGDWIFDKNGKPTKVLAVFPQGVKQVYEVYLADGRIAECCKDHLWLYRDSEKRERVQSIEEILERASKLQNGLKTSNGSGYRFKIPVNQAVEFEEKELKVDPYVMGLALGDGSFRYDKTNKSFTFSSETDELPKRLAEKLNCVCCKNSQYNYSYSFKKNKTDRHSLWVEEIFAEYPELWNKKSYDKFIPQVFLFGSINQRWKLFQGLMDTDGSVDKHGTISFSTTSKQLADQIIFLANSLGFLAKKHIDKRAHKYTCGVAFDIVFSANKEQKLKVFTLPTKLQKVQQYVATKKRTVDFSWVSITDIKPTNRFAEMTCFTVDNSEHLFLMNDFIVTHNTRNMIANLCKMCYPFYYDTTQRKWIVNGHNANALYVTTEMSLDEVQTFVWAYLSGVNEEIILNGAYQGDEEERVNTAIELTEYYKTLTVYLMPDPNIKELELNVRRECLQKGIDVIGFDYIHVSPSLISEYGAIKIADHVALGMLSAALKNLANELNVFVWSATQSNYTDEDDEFGSPKVVRGSKSIIDKCDVASFRRIPTEKQLQQVAQLIQTNGGIIPNRFNDFYKNRRGRLTAVRAWYYQDMGTGRSKSLFITNPNNTPLDDFRFLQAKVGDFEWQIGK